MHDDVTVIPSSGCNVINSPTVIYNYSSNLRKTYVQVGGRWYFTSQSSYTTIPSGAQCVDVSSINSNAVFYPIFIFIAFVLAIFVWSLVWRLIRPLLRVRV